ncbi:hypothetical protein E2C01_045619 [Portunus trituberculatus]|uniref:Uncharacterized protein n=1 Tax=Portunus trituberculatus TaxID=210409 RepID=A0A5B7G1P1_PORTR|nr:hypothetical protein [Portunus trituberculatus]
MKIAKLGYPEELSCPKGGWDRERTLRAKFLNRLTPVLPLPAPRTDKGPAAVCLNRYGEA